jgi:hypothetical protein
VASLRQANSYPPSSPGPGWGRAIHAADQLIYWACLAALVNVARDIAKTETYVTSRRERTRSRCCSHISSALLRLDDSG